MSFDVDKYWYQSSLNWKMRLLLPFSTLFSGLSGLRRRLYAGGWFKAQKFAVPVIVVGNLTVGGTGKTPFVIWLANFLKAQGFKPGIVSRGVGGIKHAIPHIVMINDDVKVVGDEALLLQEQTQCPVVICAHRAKAVASLLNETACNIVISDDGLQHYRLGRDIEIVLIDAKRGLGNGRLLPAGPLREKPNRLQTVDFILLNHRLDSSAPALPNIQLPIYAIRSKLQSLQSLATNQIRSLEAFANTTVHAVAGIGHPELFFKYLENAGLNIIRHVFPDHYRYQPQDLTFADKHPIIMTAKDAVKCKQFAVENVWQLPLEIIVDDRLSSALLAKLHS